MPPRANGGGGHGSQALADAELSLPGGLEKARTSASHSQPARAHHAAAVSLNGGGGHGSEALADAELGLPGGRKARVGHDPHSQPVRNVAVSRPRAALIRATESRPWKFVVIALVLLDLAVVMAEVALSNAHPELEACKERPPTAVAAAEGLHITTLALLVALNAEWIARVLILGPLRFFSHWQHWVDAGLVSVALGLEVALHGSAALTANLGLIILRLARVAHALIELSVAETARGARAARVRAMGLAWRLAARAALAQVRLEKMR